MRGRVLLERVHRRYNELPRIGPTVDFEVCCFDPLLEHTRELQRHRCPTASHDEAPKAIGCKARSEECRARADVRADDMRIVELESVGQPNDEFSHRTWTEQLIPAFRVAESR